jgi:hypothetical protein
MDATADAVARFENRDVPAGARQKPRRCQSGGAGSDD